MIELDNPIIARRIYFNSNPSIYEKSMVDEATKHGVLPNIKAMLDNDENKYNFEDASNNNGVFTYDPTTQTFYIDGELQLIELMNYYILYKTTNSGNLKEAKSFIYINKSLLSIIISILDAELYSLKLRLLDGEIVIQLPEEMVQYAKGKGGRIFANDLNVTFEELSAIIATLAHHANKDVWEELNQMMEHRYDV